MGGVLSFITATLLINAELYALQTTVNGWSITLKCGAPGYDILLRAACAKYISAADLVEEAGYWIMTVDGTGHALNVQHDYTLLYPEHGSEQ